MDFELFQSRCIKKFCPRKVKYEPKTCPKLYKQQSCYSKYLRNGGFKNIGAQATESIKKDQELRKLILERDGNKCRLSSILTAKEKQLIIHKYKEEFLFLSKFLDVAHIIPRSRAPHLKWELTNVVLIYRYFHQLLDAKLHPIYRVPISEEIRIDWFTSALEGKRLPNTLLNLEEINNLN